MPRQNNRRGRNRDRSAGFTLIEITLVLLIVALLTTMVAVSFASATRASRVSDAVDQLRLRDTLAREQAVRFDRPVVLKIVLPSGSVGIENIRIAGRSIQSPNKTIECSPLGHTPSYAVLLSDSSGRRCWMVVAGLTGRTSTTTNDADVAAIFANIESTASETSGVEAPRHDLD